MGFKDVLFWFLFALTMFTILWIVFGNSPTVEQGLLILVLTIAIKNNSDINGLKVQFKNFERRFNSLASDFKKHINKA